MIKSKKLFFNKRYLIFPILIFVLGSLLRLYRLGHHSFWGDEVFILNAVNLPYKEIFFNQLHEPTPPLFLLVTKLWMSFFNQNEYMIRLLPCLFGILSLILVYLISKELFNRRIALMSSFFFAISPFHIFYSQELRTYSLLLFLSLLSFYIFVKIMKTDLCKWYFILGLVNSFIIFTHYFGIFLIIIETAYFLIKRKQNLIKKLTLSLAPLIIPIVFLLSTFTKDQIIKPSRSLIISIVEFLLTPVYFTTGYHLITRELSLILLLCSLMIIFIFFCLPHIILIFKIYKKKFVKSISDKIFLLYIIGILPILVILIVALLINPIYLARYLIAYSFPFFILLSLAIHDIKKSSIRAIFILGIIILSSISLFDYYSPSFKKIGDWKKIATILDKYNQQVIILNPTSTMTAEYPLKYYSSSYKYHLSLNNLNNTNYWIVDWSCEKDYFCTKDPKNKIRLKRQNYYKGLGYDLVFISGYIELYVPSNIKFK